VIRIVLTAAVFVLLALPATSFAADGTALYKANCASCHGDDGTGDTPAGKAMNVTSIKGKSAEAIAKAVRENDKHTGPSGKLTDEQLTALATAAAAL
jgi:mono/diheme cytochrome c family protein